MVIHHENIGNPARCFVKLFKVNVHPIDQKDALYLKLPSNPTQQCWYSVSPIGHHTLSQTVARMCQEAGIPGYRTNHSLRAITATRAAVVEQLIMGITV